MDSVNFYKECKLCGCSDPAPSHFWKTHHLKESEYAWTYEPRVSKLTGKLIPFKSREFYFNADFCDKNELKKWLKENPEMALDYATSLIKARVDQGKVKYSPSQVEMRSLCSPNVIWFEQLTNYNLQCKTLGLITRFKYKIDKLEFSNDNLHFIIDTREQKSLKFDKGHSVAAKKLDFGDYWAENSKSNHVYIERKNLSDFVGTLSSGYERFEKEIKRAQSKNSYLIIMVEECIGNALAFNMLPHISKNIKASPEFIFHKVRTLMQEYSNIQFVFIDGRVKAADFVSKIYQFNGDPSEIDWQYAVDKKFI